MNSVPLHSNGPHICLNPNFYEKWVLYRGMCDQKVWKYFWFMCMVILLREYDWKSEWDKKKWDFRKWNSNRGEMSRIERISLPCNNFLLVETLYLSLYHWRIKIITIGPWHATSRYSCRPLQCNLANEKIKWYHMK